MCGNYKILGAASTAMKAKGNGQALTAERMSGY